MPKVKRTRKPPPDGWELIEPTIDELDAKMREGLFGGRFIEHSVLFSTHSTRSVSPGYGKHPQY